MNTAIYAINDRFFICAAVISKSSQRLVQNILIIGIALIGVIGVPSIRDHFRDRGTEHFCIKNEGTLRKTPRGELLCFYGGGKVEPTLQIQFPKKIH